jgi:hypothetical protein
VTQSLSPTKKEIILHWEWLLPLTVSGLVYRNFEREKKQEGEKEKKRKEREGE